MSDLRALLNPPSTVHADGPLEAFFTPMPGRLRLPEDSPLEEADDETVAASGSQQKTPLHRVA